MSLLSSKNRRKVTYRTNEEIELAFLHLIEQFRQIDDKYGLMVSEHINDLYVHKRDNMLDYYSVITSLKKHH